MLELASQHNLNLSYLTYTKTGVEKIETEIAEKASSQSRVVILLDFNSMSIANEFGYARQVDQYLEEFTKLAERCFKENNVAGKLIRIGGDEYAIMMEHNPAITPEILNTLKGAMDGLHKQIFIKDERYEKAQDFAAIRSAYRALRSDYFKHCAQEKISFDRDGFKLWLNQQLPEHAALSDVMLAGTSTGGVQKLVAAHIQQKKAPEMMSVTVATTIIDGPLTRDTTRQALIQNVRTLHDLKLNGTDQTWGEIEALDPNITMRKDDLAQIEEAEQGLGLIVEFEEIAKDFKRDPRYGENNAFAEAAMKEVQFNAARDPSLSNTLRGEYCRGMTIGDFYPLEEGQRIFPLTVDYPGYGIFNNGWDYVRANGLISRVIDNVQKHFGENKPCPQIRISGGKMHFMFFKEIDPKALHKFKSVLAKETFRDIREDMFKEGLYAEASERASLRALLHDTHQPFSQYAVSAKTKSRSLGDSSATTAMKKNFPETAVYYNSDGIEVSSTTTFGEIIAKLP